jgi:6,7-dimethyl-8-ribityllumazine synthase
MSKTPGSISNLLEGTGLRIGLVQARYNPEITEPMKQVCFDTLLELGVQAEDIVHVTVPGALELATILQRMAETGAFDAFIALGAVVKGDTYHFELVCNESAAGITRVGLDFNVPIANAVLTTYTMEQAQSRIVEKAASAAHVAVEMANLTLEIDDWALISEEEDV